MRGTLLALWTAFVTCQALAAPPGAGTPTGMVEALPFDAAVFRIAPRGWTLRFAQGLQPPRTLSVPTASGDWERRMSDALEGTNVAMTVDRDREEVLFSDRNKRTTPIQTPSPVALTQAAPAVAEEVKQARSVVPPPAPLTPPNVVAPTATPAEGSIAIVGAAGDTVSQVLKRFLSAQQYTLVWSLGVDLRITVPYRRTGNDLAELIKQVMEDFSLKGSLYPANRVLLVRDPAHRNEEN